MTHRALDAEVFEPIVERMAAQLGMQGIGHRLQVEPGVGQRAGQGLLHRAVNHGLVERGMEGDQRCIAEPLLEGSQRLGRRCAGTLFAHADAVQQDVVLVGRRMGLAQHGLEAVGQIDAWRGLAVQAQRDGGDRQQAVVAQVQAAGFDIDDDPALGIHRLRRRAAEQALEQAQRR